MRKPMLSDLGTALGTLQIHLQLNHNINEITEYIINRQYKCSWNTETGDITKGDFKITGFRKECQNDNN